LYEANPEVKWSTFEFCVISFVMFYRFISCLSIPERVERK
jgi:hypothetical protein